MILVERDAGLCLVDQVEHGRVAGTLAAAWGNDAFEAPTSRESVIFAAERHDEGWRAADAIPLVNAVEQRPLHFLEIDAAEHIRLYRNGVDWVSGRDAYAGLLVGMHWTGLYRGRWARPGARGRLADGAGGAALDEVVQAEEHRWVTARHHAWTADEPRSEFEARLWHHYELLQLWDLMSLYLCVAPPEPTPALTAVPWGPQLTPLRHEPERVLLPRIRRGAFGEAAGLTVWVGIEGIVHVEPWPFSQNRIQLEIAQSGAIRRPVRWTIARSQTAGGPP